MLILSIARVDCPLSLNFSHAFSSSFYPNLIDLPAGLNDAAGVLFAVKSVFAVFPG